MNEGTAKSSEASAKLPSFVRPGFGNIAPYIVVNGAGKFIEFLKTSFQGTERLRVARPDGAVMHAEVGIGNSVIELAAASEQHPSRLNTTHLYRIMYLTKVKGNAIILTWLLSLISS
jgi:uncharacterized glyoxalase superfamily protein PhnB